MSEPYIYDEMRRMLAVLVDELTPEEGLSDDEHELHKSLQDAIDQAEDEADEEYRLRTNAEEGESDNRKALERCWRAMDDVLDTVPDLLPTYMGQVDDRWAAEALRDLQSARNFF